jgi:hypothetical protein
MKARVTEAHTGGIADRWKKWVRSTMCGLHGHDLLLSFEPSRICLRCVTCSYETHGWILKDVETKPYGPHPRPAVLIQENAR